LKVFLSLRAKAFLDGASPGLKRRLEAKILELLATPYPSGCKKLKGAPNAYRLRVGDYRILYVISKRGEIVVFKISPRESAYD
jgi:mRNA interferase RelE/StbE